jgi:micrococcal nuclease
MIKTLFFSLLLCICAHADTITGKVVHVEDGDTITILNNQTEHKIRFADIDAPETAKRGKPGQPFGQASKKYLNELCAGKTVTVEFDPQNISYDRKIGTVYLNKHSINQHMIEVGLAWHYRQYSNSKLLLDLETKARTSKTGLWEDPDPIAPWEFRRHLKNNTTPTKITNTGNNTEVWITKSGKKYHKESCKYAKYAQKTTQTTAITHQLTPCGVCKPN